MSLLRRHTIAAIWIGGLILAVLLYITGPERFFIACAAFLEWLDDSFHAMLAALGAQAFTAIRAAAIALYVVFLVLCGLAIHRNIRAWGGLIVITILFVILVWRPWFEPPVALGRWLTALILCAVGAIMMTQRLLMPPPPPGMRPPGWAPPPGPR